MFLTAARTEYKGERTPTKEKVGEDVKSYTGTVALQQASQNGQWDVVKCLVEEGVDMKSDAGTGTLQWAG